MTSLTMAANLIPTAVVLTGAGDVPGRDGYVYRPADMGALAAKEENRLLTGFKWRSDAAGVRARTLLIQQLMLDTALSAVLQGAGSLSWRIAVEDDMGDGGRRAVLDAVENGAAAATIASGLAPIPGTERVSWTPETAALGAYLLEYISYTDAQERGYYEMRVRIPARRGWNPRRMCGAGHWRGQHPRGNLLAEPHDPGAQREHPVRYADNTLRDVRESPGTYRI